MVRRTILLLCFIAIADGVMMKSAESQEEGGHHRKRHHGKRKAAHAQTPVAAEAPVAAPDAGTPPDEVGEEAMPVDKLQEKSDETDKRVTGGFLNDLKEIGSGLLHAVAPDLTREAEKKFVEFALGPRNATREVDEFSAVGYKDDETTPAPVPLPVASSEAEEAMLKDAIANVVGGVSKGLSGALGKGAEELDMGKKSVRSANEALAAAAESHSAEAAGAEAGTLTLEKVADQVERGASEMLEAAETIGAAIIEDTDEIVPVIDDAIDDIGNILVKFVEDAAPVAEDIIDNAGAVLADSLDDLINSDASGESDDSDELEMHKQSVEDEPSGKAAKLCAEGESAYLAFHARTPGMCGNYCVPHGACWSAVTRGDFAYLGIQEVGECRKRGFTLRNVFGAGSGAPTPEFFQTFRGACKGMTMTKWMKPISVTDEAGKEKADKEADKGEEADKDKEADKEADKEVDTEADKEAEEEAASVVEKVVHGVGQIAEAVAPVVTEFLDSVLGEDDEDDEDDEE